MRAAMFKLRSSNQGMGDSMQRDGDPDLLRAAGGHAVVHGDQRIGIPRRLEHLIQHVAACTRDVGGIRLCVEARLSTQHGLVDDQCIKRHVEVRAALVRRDVPRGIVTCDYVVVPESCELSAAADFDDHG